MTYRDLVELVGSRAIADLIWFRIEQVERVQFKLGFVAGMFTSAAVALAVIYGVRFL